MITDVPGFAVGHWTDDVGLTGCTVVVAPEGTVGSGEVRGGAPATREFEMLDPVRRVTTVDAVLLTGGSAFGLAAARRHRPLMSARPWRLDSHVDSIPGR